MEVFSVHLLSGNKPFRYEWKMFVFRTTIAIPGTWSFQSNSNGAVYFL